MEAINSPSLSLAKIRKEQGEIILDAALDILVADLIESFNIGKTMNELQLRFTIEAIKSDYYYLKLDEFKFIFSQAKKGRYGTMYDRIDCAVICEWIEKYMAERDAMLIQKNIEIANERGRYSPDEWTEVLKKFKAAAKELPPAEPEPKPFSQRHQTDEDKLANELYSEFDVLYESQEEIRKRNKAVKFSASRLVHYGGKWINSVEYIEVKLKEMKKI